MQHLWTLTTYQDHGCGQGRPRMQACGCPVQHLPVVGAGQHGAAVRPAIHPRGLDGGVGQGNKRTNVCSGVRVGAATVRLLDYVVSIADWQQ